MKITLLYSELLFDITNKNRSEVALLDPAVRYRAEIGADKEEEVRRCLLGSLSTLTANYMRFMRESSIVSDTDIPDIPSSIEIDLVGSDRRFGGKKSAIVSCMHSLLVNMTLSQFYLSVGHPELSKMRSDLALSEVQVLKKLLYTKQPPCLC